MIFLKFYKQSMIKLFNFILKIKKFNNQIQTLIGRIKITLLISFFQYRGF